ncbi:hypothetical protein BCR33DRAFT_257649 [Rhizoclosmatium globosum]|uniref:Uncharacterized protein n=1 Tax=Rhizoclosmatium globosum TaxID=329046 RepID=A0A1Y2CAE4_9FUNG|nr:hypothetical protein BCR33DRAFT_257649 [Rhizoclosmatium globosum]|eukprot:ORY43305.1 hypothetical protein BCR33DRAFT_257649 [Rhizoclosmatium globosum]
MVSLVAQGNLRRDWFFRGQLPIRISITVGVAKKTLRRGLRGVGLCTLHIQRVEEEVEVRLPDLCLVERVGGFSVFSGMTSMSRVSGMPLPLPHRQVSPTALVFPRSPNIPFLEINNSLQLHLKFKVFSNDQEKILTWVGGSVVAQVSPYLQGIAANASANASANDSFISSFLSSSSNSSTSSNQQDPRVAATIERMQTVERASYLLLTDKALYIFTPTFAMPYDPFSKGNNGPTTAPTAHLSNVIAQVRYDDPSRTLKLARRIPLTHLARMDVGPNRQYLGMHFLSDASGADKPPINQNVRRVSGIGVEGSLKSGGGGASRQLNRKDSSMSLGAGGQNPLPGIRSLVFLSRDRNATTMVLDSLVPVLYEMQPKGGKFNIKGVDGKVRIVNQDVEWSLSALREKVLLRAGGAKHVVLNEVDVDGRVDWRDVVAKRKQLQVQENAVPEKKSWFSELLGTPLSSGSSSSRASIDATNVAPVPVPKTIIHDDDCDSATSSSVVLDKVIVFELDGIEILTSFDAIGEF